MYKPLLYFAVIAAISGPIFCQAPDSLLIGPGDQVHIQVMDAPEMDQHPRVTDAGQVPITGVGSVQVAGLNPAGAARQIHDGLINAHFMNHPEVTVSIEQYATQTVSVLGQVKATGAYPISTARSVLDVLALAGGLTEIADRNILIERRGSASGAIHYNLSNNAETAIQQRVLVYPGDTIVVPKAGIVYILGDVNRPGGYAMTNNESTLSVLQALAIAGGLSRSAKQGHARLLRKDVNGNANNRDLSVADLEHGRLPDIPMLPGDVLYVPFSFIRNIATNGAGSIAASTSGAAIYALP